MKIAIVATKHGSHGGHVLTHLSRGIQSHGDEVGWVHSDPDFGHLHECDAAVIVCDTARKALFCGGAQGRTHSLRQVVREYGRKSGKPVLIAETGFIQNSKALKRNECSLHETYWALGWDGIKANADYCLPDRCDGSRFMWDYPPEDRGETDDTVVVIGQVPNGYAEGFTTDWTNRYLDVGAAANRQGLKMIVKAHPGLGRLGLRRLDFKMAESGHRLDVETSPRFLMSRAESVVTWMSNACVDALLAGTPLICLDRMAVCYEFAANDLESLRGPLGGSYADRVDLLHRISFMQWRLREMSDGSAWAQLRGKVCQN